MCFSALNFVHTHTHTPHRALGRKIYFLVCLTVVLIMSIWTVQEFSCAFFLFTWSQFFSLVYFFFFRVWVTSFLPIFFHSSDDQINTHSFWSNSTKVLSYFIVYVQKSKIICSEKKYETKRSKTQNKRMPSDELSTMYGNPLSEFLMFLVDFIVFAVRSIYFLLETFILTILPDRYRKLKVSTVLKSTTHFLCFVLVSIEFNAWIFKREWAPKTINLIVKKANKIITANFHNVFKH